MTNWDTRLAVFDLETTGVDVDTSRIVSACIAVLDADGSLRSEWTWLADPEIDIPQEASDVHGITTAHARAEGRSSAVVVSEITTTLRTLLGTGVPLVVYNAPYDLSLLDRECRRHHLEPLDYPSPVIDPLVIDKAVDRYRKGKRTLVAAAERYGVVLDGAHDAAADAIAAGRVAQALAREFPDHLDVPFTDLHGRQEIWYAEQAASFQQYIREVKGDLEFVADAEWPVRPLGDPFLFEDTIPLPRPRLRPSKTVPTIDVTGPLPVLEAAPNDWRRIPPIVVVEQSVVETSVTIEVFDEPIIDDQLAEPVKPRSARSRSSKANVIRIAAAVITDTDGRSLLIRKQGSSVFMQPGGRIETGESALTALTREVREELGLTVDPGETEYIGSYRAIAAADEETIVRAEVFCFTAAEPPVPGAAIDEILWVDRIDDISVEVAPLSRDSLLPLWQSRRPSLF